MAIVVAPLAWVLLAFGTGQVHPNWEARAHPFYEAPTGLALAGLLLGIVACLRTSPLGALVAGGAYLAYGITGLTVPRVHDVLPAAWSFADRDVPLRVPVDNGTAIGMSTPGAARSIAGEALEKPATPPVRSVAATVRTCGRAAG